MKYISLLLLLMLPFVLMAAEYDIRFELGDGSELEKVTRLTSVDDVQGNTVFANATDEELVRLRTMGYHITFLPSRPALEQDATSADLRQLRDWDTYPTYEAYVDMMNQFAADYPDLCIVESIGQSVQGRELLVARISDNVAVEEAEPEFFYTSTMHGDETTGYILMLRLIDYLLQNYGTDPQVTNLVDNIEIYINPNANPDGTYAGGNASVNGATRRNANNIDINRNFPDPEDGPHPDGQEWQPETLRMMDFALTHSITLAANFHGGAEVVNYPWDTWEDLHADDTWYQYISHLYADLAHANSPAGYMSGFNNGITNGFQWYTTSGCRQDWMNYFAHCREVTLEISDTKLLPPAQLPAHWDYNRESLLAYMEQCLYGVSGIVTDCNGTPLDAKVTVLNHDIDNAEIFCDPDVGDYHRMLAPGDYTLQFSTYGYEPVQHSVTISQDALVQQDAVLTPQTPYTLSGLVLTIDALPIAGALVALQGSPYERVTTDADGYFCFDPVYNGDYTLQMSKEGFIAQDMAVTINGASQQVTFSPVPTAAVSFEGVLNADMWQMGGSADWTLDDFTAQDGFYSLRSGSISDNQSSTVTVEMEVTQASDLHFYRRVSSEAGYDKLAFKIDGVQQGQWSGDQDWQENVYTLYPGTHSFSWEYSKDGNTAAGADGAWIDFVLFPAHAGAAVPQGAVPAVASRLDAIYPNPFNPQTTIAFSVGSEMPVAIDVYNLHGQRVRTVARGIFGSGSHTVVWDGVDSNGLPCSSGVYFVSCKTNVNVSTQKIVLMK
jgi:hypothetical protein